MVKALTILCYLLFLKIQVTISVPRPKDKILGWWVLEFLTPYGRNHMLFLLPQKDWVVLFTQPAPSSINMEKIEACHWPDVHPFLLTERGVKLIQSLALSLRIANYVTIMGRYQHFMLQRMSAYPSPTRWQEVTCQALDLLKQQIKAICHGAC